MKLNTLLEYLLKEAKLAPEAPKGSPAGEYLFAPERKDTPKPKEINTDIEEEWKNILIGHYKGLVSASDTERVMIALKGLERKNKYKKLLTPPDGLAYRFVSGLKPAEASKLYLNNLPIADIIAEPNKAFYVSDIGTVDRPAAKSTIGSGKSNISSWTVAPTLPNFEDFVSADNGTVAVVLVADISSNEFVLNPYNLIKYAEGLDDTADNLISKEYEVVAIGSVNVLEASAVYIDKASNETKKPKFSKELEYKIYRSIPRPNIDASVKDGKLLSPKFFKPTFDYINTVLNKWEKIIDPKTAKAIKNGKDYKLWANYAANGVKHKGGDSYGSRYMVISNILKAISTSINGELIDSETVHSKLMNALNLKAKSKL